MKQNKIRNISTVLFFLLPNLLMAAAGRHFRPPRDPKILIGLLAFCGVVLLVAVGYLALCLVFSVLKPGLIRKSSDYLDKAFLKNILTGLLVSIGYMLFLGIATQFIPRGHGVRSLLAAPIMLVLFLHGLVGFTMIVHGLGEKIHSNINSRYVGSTFMAVLAGGAVFILTGLIPFIGVICFVFVNLAGIGLATRTVLGIRREKLKKLKSIA